MPGSPVLYLSLVFCALSSTGDSYYVYTGIECYSLGSLENIEFVGFLVYNKAKVITYNSTENKVIPYSEYGSKLADEFNNQPALLQLEKERFSSGCRDFGKKMSVVDKTVKPKVTLKSQRTDSGDQPIVLVCSAYDYYPKNIQLTWLRDDEKVTADVATTEELADGDWHYQIHSQLEYSPKPGERITCMVEHLSLNKPELVHWSKETLSEPERDKIVVGAAALLLGGIIAATGLFYYKTKQRGLGWTSVNFDLAS